MGSNLKRLEEYYSNEHKNKIFCTRLCVEGKSFDILYDYDKKDEIAKFVSSFSEYLPYYVYNADTLEQIDTSGEFTKKLSEVSNNCWHGPSIPTRDKKINGIFGEVFLDFYERIVRNAKLASTYASRRDFKSNTENKGYDNVLFIINQNTIEFVFAESKFVVDRNSASTELIKDIKGEPRSDGKDGKLGHLTADYMNDYVTFVVEKNSFFSDEDKRILKPFFIELNDVLINKGRKFIQFLIDSDIKINCVFFAIFHNKKTNPKEFINEYDQIEKEAKQHLESIGFKNYSIEIVFIPTNATSMEIKGAIDEYYTEN